MTAAGTAGPQLTRPGVLHRLRGEVGRRVAAVARPGGVEELPLARCRGRGVLGPDVAAGLAHHHVALEVSRRELLQGADRRRDIAHRLQKMAEAYHALPKNWQDRIQPLFISVDPERDTPEVLKNYVALFLPELVGLTGTPVQIDAIKRAYKIYAAKIPDGDSYTMDHSSYIYLMAPDGTAKAMFKTSDTAKDIARHIAGLSQ